MLELFDEHISLSLFHLSALSLQISPGLTFHMFKTNTELWIMELVLLALCIFTVTSMTTKLNNGRFLWITLVLWRKTSMWEQVLVFHPQTKHLAQDPACWWKEKQRSILTNGSPYIFCLRVLRTFTVNHFSKYKGWNRLPCWMKSPLVKSRNEISVYHTLHTNNKRQQ